MGRSGRDGRKRSGREDRAATGGGAQRALAASWLGAFWGGAPSAEDEKRRRRAMKREEVPGSDDESADSSRSIGGSDSSDTEDPRQVRARAKHRSSAAAGTRRSEARLRSSKAVTRGSSRRKAPNSLNRLQNIMELLFAFARSLLPRTNHGWGMLFLCILMVFYAFDFFAVLRSTPQPEAALANANPAAKSSASQLHTLPDASVPNQKLETFNSKASVLTKPLKERPDTDRADELSDDAARNEFEAVLSKHGGAGPKKSSEGRAALNTEHKRQDKQPEAENRIPQKQRESAQAEAEQLDDDNDRKAVPASAPATEAAPSTRAKSKTSKKIEFSSSNSQTDAAKTSSTSAKSAAETAWVERASVNSVSPFNRGERKDLMVSPDIGVLPRAEIERYYQQLARAYLEPFAALGGVPRKYFVEILKRRTYALTPPGASKGTTCVLVQIVNQRVYLLDPYDVRKNAKPFYKTRMDEALWLISRVAARARIADTEFLLSIHDCVQTASAEHSYRAASFVEHSPVFTIVGCNFSDNIPFPMWEGTGERGGGYSGWDKQMELFARDTVSWDQKEARGVFRGGLRPSMYFRDKKLQDDHCDDVGRTALLAHAAKNPELLNVSVGGSCGGVHHGLSRMSPEQQHKFKYVIYAEGNCFWADRLNRELFGPSAVLKQETPCGQFYEPLLQPMGHYVPIDFNFKDLAERVRWLREHDAEARRIVRASNDFARDFLSLAGIELYVQQLLREYTTLLKEPVHREKGATDVTVDSAAAFR